MNYVRDFYKQSGKFQVAMNYYDSGSAATFGLSGNNTFGFAVSNSIVYCEGFPVSSLDESDSIFVTVCGNGSAATAWIDDKPVYTKTGTFNFDKIYCDSAGNFSFNETLYGEQPDLDVSFSGWDGQTGYIWVKNNGTDMLEISSATLAGSFIHVDTFASSIAPGASGQVRVSYLSNSSTSGTGQLVLDTNAGEFSLGQFLDFEWTNNNGFLNMYFENGFYNPSGTSRFFIQNNYLRDVEVGIFFDDNTTMILTDESGTIFLTDSGEELILSKERFATVTGSGLFTVNIATAVTGSKTVPVEYEGWITGVGGRLGATGTRYIQDSANITVYTEGDLYYNYDVTASSIISGDLYYSASLTGSLYALVGPGSGEYHFNQVVTGSVNVCYNAQTLVAMVPSVFTPFTGMVDNVIELEDSWVGPYTFMIQDEVEVSEGFGSFLDVWDIDIFDVDRGTENLFVEGRYTSSGFGTTGVTYRIPEGERISGEVRYSSDYSEPFLAKLIMRVTDFNSINDQIQIEVR